MRVYNQPRFNALMLQLYRDFVEEALPVDVGQWQGLDVRGDRSKVTWELREAVLAMRMPDLMESAQRDFLPNLPWAEDHFQERVSGKPLNPPPSSGWWPFSQGGHKDHLSDGQFSHTYPERMWPRHAGHSSASCPHSAEMAEGREEGHYQKHWGCDLGGRHGIRFSYGDLADVVDRLTNSPYTRQAYLPIWFPEDTGAPKGERVPCSLGYLFLIRQNQLHVTYHIRSCDFMRHFRDDVYMAVRLGQWVRDAVDLDGIGMGELTMHISSFHIFEGDRAMVRHKLREIEGEENRRLFERMRAA